MDMKSIEVSGKTVDEAIFKGLQQLEISIDEVEIQIIKQETKGILGFGAKPAIVRLVQKAAEEVEVPDFSVLSRRDERGRRDSKPSERRDEPRRKEPERPKQNKGGTGADTAIPPRQSHPKAAERTLENAPNPAGEQNVRPEERKQPRESVAQGNTQRAEKGAELQNSGDGAVKSVRPSGQDRKNERSRPANRKPESSFGNAANINPEEREYSVKAAQDEPGAVFLAETVRLMGIEGELSAYADEEALMIRINSSSKGVLIGYRGETLDALQYITSLVTNKNRRESGYRRVTVDTEGYRKKREATLTGLARKVASQVRSSGRAKALEPMNPYERRILHSALQNNPHVSTHSEGEEPNRRVVVTPKRRATGTRSKEQI